ncbi:hypothetical protein [Flavobacterium sp.]|uniref:hypothetical protein n=1 Tax=Flavobacterium sp. TaxID=239 RepID=UPI002614C1FA|nr:hypothetical protein [Flavobacterium sp.]MDD3003494.1 hypothetical protein [Flavobacterium sp.]
MKNISQKKRRFFLFGAPLLLLFIPLIAMQFTKEVNWSSFDFFLCAVLLFTVAFLCELVFTRVKNTTKRFFICLGILFLLLLLWTELAVGIFNSPISGS